MMHAFVMLCAESIMRDCILDFMGWDLLEFRLSTQMFNKVRVALGRHKRPSKDD